VLWLRGRLLTIDYSISMYDKYSSRWPIEKTKTISTSFETVVEDFIDAELGLVRSREPNEDNEVSILEGYSEQ
jgi:hypothetical protein